MKRKIAIAAALVAMAGAGAGTYAGTNERATGQQKSEQSSSSGSLQVLKQTKNAPNQTSEAGSWTFAVSGDSSDCGELIMPGIARAAKQLHAQFYWHLGNYRSVSRIDEDMYNAKDIQGNTLTRQQYLDEAWPDVIQWQLHAFAPVPVYLGIGTRETIPPESREKFVETFTKLPKAPWVTHPGASYDPQDPTALTRYHWRHGDVEFIYLDNATSDQFDSKQMAWLEKILARDAEDAAVHTLVVGMNEALPDSLAAEHGMNFSPQETVSGRKVYLDLLRWRDQTKKRVYVLASHAHFYMAGIFDTPQWRAYVKEYGPVLPGWIVGTAGAKREPLPPDAVYAKQAMTDVYGFLLGSVSPNGAIQFQFHRIEGLDIPPFTGFRFTPEFGSWCFTENKTTQ